MIEILLLGLWGSFVAAVAPSSPVAAVVLVAAPLGIHAAHLAWTAAGWRRALESLGLTAESSSGLRRASATGRGPRVTVEIRSQWWPHLLRMRQTRVRTHAPALPDLSLRPTSLSGVLFGDGDFGDSDLRTGDEAFDQRFRVTGPDLATVLSQLPHDVRRPLGDATDAGMQVGPHAIAWTQSGLQSIRHFWPGLVASVEAARNANARPEDASLPDELAAHVLKDPAPGFRRRCFSALAEADATRARELASRLLHRTDTPPGLWWDAAASLGHAPNEAELIPLLNAPPDDVAPGLLLRLERIGTGRCVVPLSAFAKASTTHRREARRVISVIQERLIAVGAGAGQLTVSDDSPGAGALSPADEALDAGQVSLSDS